LRIRHVLEHCLLILEQEPPDGHPVSRDTRWVFLGKDPSGIDLEVIAVETELGHLLVIHAMEMRSRYRDVYMEVRRWRR
jgi:hypothetical protein